MEQALNPVDWYMKLLAPLSPDIKLDLISKLSESLKDTHTYSKNLIQIFRFLQCIIRSLGR